MSQLTTNTASLQAILDTVNSLDTMPTVEQATPTVTVSSSGLITASATQTAGYVSAGTKSTTKQLTTQAAQTITPGTSDKTIASGVYLTGAQTIKGDANLVATNIAEGVSIFGVTGTHAGGGSSSGEENLIKNMIERNASFSISLSDVTRVHSFAFYSCSSITAVSFPACTSIGSSAFYQCISLASISFPACTSIGSAAFYGCSKLSRVSFPACTSMGMNAFKGCQKLTAAYFPVLLTINQSAFYGCSSLTTVSFPTCSYIEACAFRGCSKLTAVSFPACTSIRLQAFYSCTNLSALWLTGSSVCTLGNSNAFSGTNLSKTGYIYVPASLVSSYQTATNWTYFSSRFSAID